MLQVQAYPILIPLRIVLLCLSSRPDLLMRLKLVVLPGDDRPSGAEASID